MDWLHLVKALSSHYVILNINVIGYLIFCHFEFDRITWLLILINWFLLLYYELKIMKTDYI